MLCDPWLCALLPSQCSGVVGDEDCSPVCILSLLLCAADTRVCSPSPDPCLSFIFLFLGGVCAGVGVGAVVLFFRPSVLFLLLTLILFLFPPHAYRTAPARWGQANSRASRSLTISAKRLPSFKGKSFTLVCVIARSTLCLSSGAAMALSKISTVHDTMKRKLLQAFNLRFFQHAQSTVNTLH